MVTTSIVTTIVAYSQLKFNFSLSVLRERWYLALTKSLIHRLVGLNEGDEAGVRYNESGRKKNSIIRNLFEIPNKIIRRLRKDKNEIE